MEWFVKCEELKVWGLRRHVALLHLNHKCSGGRHVGRSHHTHVLIHIHALTHTHMFTHVHAHTHITTLSGLSPEPEYGNEVAILPPPSNTHVHRNACV